MATSLILPDLSSYQFQYDNYGDLITLTMPTGGSINYTWTTNGSFQRILTKRLRFDGTNTSEWDYGGNKVTGPPDSSSVRSDTVYTPVTPGAGCDNRIDHVDYYQGSASSGTHLQTISYSYQVLDNPFLTDLGTCAVSFLQTGTTTTTSPSSLVAETTQSFDLSWGLGLGFGSTLLSASIFWNIDSMGRVQNQASCLPPTCATPYYGTYGYDYLGQVTSQTNQSGTLTYAPDTAGRIESVSSSTATLASVNTSFGFYPTGYVHIMSYGNGITETSVWDGRLQACRKNWNSSGSFLSLCGDAVPSGNLQDFFMNYGTWGSTDNGNLTAWAGTGSLNFGRTYTYDGLNRLSTISSPADPSGCTGLSWNYDGWGNRKDQNVTSGSCGASHLSFNVTNQISGLGYDAVGNLTYDGSNHYTYDGENRIIGVSGTTSASYAYDAEGRRIQKIVSGVTTQYVFDLFGQPATELQGGSYSKGYVYFNGELLAQYDSGTTHFIHKDHLGSTRLVTTVAGTICASLDFLPFGEQVSSGSGCTSHKFTGKERDPETGNDNFTARYYGSGMGRFMSADPSGISLANLGDPQQLNLYSYVRNNPLSLTDPTGLNQCYAPPNNDAVDTNGEALIDFQEFNDDSQNCLEAGGTYIVSNVTDVVTAPPPDDEPEDWSGLPGGITGNPASRLTNAQNAAINNPAFQPNTPQAGVTHCNQAVCAEASAMGAPTGALTNVQGNPLKAEQIRANLAKPGSGYREVDAVTAVTLANAGVLVIGTGPGHVFTLAPGGTPGGTPMVANVGAQNGILPLNYVFTRADLGSVRYYAPN